MNLTTISIRFVGHWKGTKELYFSGPPTPDNVSESELAVQPVATGKFLSFTYTQDMKGVVHEGFLLVGKGNKEDVATAAWVDSFHMSGKIMNSEGAIDRAGRVVVLGYYEAPPGHDWGWRTLIESDGERLSIEMYNILPEWKEVLAVQAKYQR